MTSKFDDRIFEFRASGFYSDSVVSTPHSINDSTMDENVNSNGWGITGILGQPSLSAPLPHFLAYQHL
jgi:hypothetical protein